MFDNKKIVSICIVFCLLLVPVSMMSKILNTNTKILIRKFENKSEYKGKWNIGLGFAKLLQNRLKKKGFTNVRVIKYNVSDTDNSNRIIISGEIRRFKFREHIIAAYRLGGYSNYTVDIAVKLKIEFLNKENISMDSCLRRNDSKESRNDSKEGRNDSKESRNDSNFFCHSRPCFRRGRLQRESNKNEIYEKLIETHISKKNYGLTLFGGPGGSKDFELNVYKELQKIPFGSRKYWKTIYGIATKDCIEKMLKWIIKTVK